MDIIEKFLKKWFSLNDSEARHVAKILYRMMKNKVQEHIRRIEEEGGL